MLSVYKKYFGSQLQRFFQQPLRRTLVPQQFYSAKGSTTFLQRFTSTFSILLSVIFLTSCEKVIDINLDNVEKKYVIEANLSDQPNSCKVILTQTKNFDENNTFNGISGAVVTIADNNASPITLVETSPGVYQSSTLTGMQGHTYNLKVTVNGQTFTSTSTMPALVPFDSLYTTERTFLDDKNLFSTVNYKDPAGVQNAYRFIQYVNGVKEETIFVRDDDSNDGLKIERTLLYFFDEEEAAVKQIRKGDSLRVDMLCINLPMYKYWYSLDQSSTGSSQSATPGNPVTNISGGALGYFSTHTIRNRAIKVP